MHRWEGVVSVITGVCFPSSSDKDSESIKPCKMEASTSAPASVGSSVGDDRSTVALMF
jgi:hypothetical protein